MGFRVHPVMKKADRSHGSRSKKRAQRETGSSRLWRQPGILAITRNKTQQRNTATCACFPLRWSSSSLKMAESDCNSVCSYDTDDSEYNFIPGHVNIDDIEVEDDENFSFSILCPSFCTLYWYRWKLSLPWYQLALSQQVGYQLCKNDKIWTGPVAASEKLRTLAVFVGCYLW